MPIIPKGIRKRGSSYIVDVTVNGKRKTTTKATLQEALDARLHLLSAMQTGREVDLTRANARAWTLQEALDKTLSTAAPEGWRGMSYVDKAALNVRCAIKFWGPDIQLKDLTRVQIDEWTADLEAQGNSDGTVNRKISALSKVMKLAITYGGLEGMPKMPRQRKEAVNRIRQISSKEEETLIGMLDLLGKPNQADAVRVLIDTGMRCSELWNVCDADVDLKQGVLLIYGTEGKGTKNGGVRSVPMTKRVREVLTRRLDEGELFPFDNTWIRHAWDTVRARMKLAHDKSFTPHVCRHTCASRLVRAGVSLTVVQAWLGHKNIQTTMRYSHLYPQDLMNAVKALEN